MNCLQLEKLEKARINLEYALEFYKSESLQLIASSSPASAQGLVWVEPYEISKQVLESLLKVKNEQENQIAATECARKYVKYIQTAIVNFAKQAKSQFKIDKDKQTQGVQIQQSLRRKSTLLGTQKPVRGDTLSEINQKRPLVEFNSSNGLSSMIPNNISFPESLTVE